MSQEQQFLDIAILFFRVFVLGLLPIAALVVFFIYVKKIITTFVEGKRVKRETKKAAVSSMSFSGSARIKKG